MNAKTRFKLNILPILYSLFAGICSITINSKNSFLYSFNESPDFHCFLTTARCILNGKVLYRDIYEQKGPFLYFLYAIGLFPNRNSLVGIYIIECLFFSAFLYFSYRIASLYLRNSICRYLAVSITAIVSSCNDAFYTGGQCEELALPFLTASIYIVLNYYKAQYPKRIPFRSVFAIGICFTVIFWIKYSLCGLFLGLVLCVIILEIKEKQAKNIPVYMGWFFFACVVGSLPIILYFGYYNSFSNLFEVYFYNNIFNYGNLSYTKGSSIFTTDFYSGYWGISFTLAPIIIYLLITKNTHFHANEKLAIILMFFGETFGVSITFNWGYCKECIYAFSIIGNVILFLIFSDQEEIAKVLHAFHLQLFNLKHCRLVFSFFSVLLVIIDADFFLPLILEIIVAYYISLQLSKYNYIISIGLLVGITIASCIYEIAGTYEIDFIFLILLFSLAFYLFHFLGNNFTTIQEKFKRNISQWKTDYLAKEKSYNLFIILLGIGVFLFCLKANSHNISDSSISLEDYPAYQISNYIQEHGGNHPSFVYYECMDLGIYWLTDTYPTDKFFCSLNVGLDEMNDSINEKICDGSVDYVISLSDISIADKYKIVYKQTGTSMGDGLFTYYLYEKK